MKTTKYIIAICCLFFCTSVAAQETDVAKNDFTVKIVNKRGRPVTGVVVQAIDAGEVGITDKGGEYVFSSMGDEDHIRMFLPKHGEKVVSAAGLDSLLVIIRSNSTVSYQNPQNNLEINTGYNTLPSSQNTHPAAVIDAEKIVEQSSATNLFELIAGRVAGVVVSGKTVTIRGTNSIMLSSEPLVVVDGTVMGTLADADAVVNVRDVKSVSVVKDGAMYGSRGANGVIVITTKGTR